MICAGLGRRITQLDRQAVLRGELEIALVVRRHAPSPRLRRSPSARSCRPRPASFSPVSGCSHEQAGGHALLFLRAPARLPSRAPRLHSSTKAASFGLSCAASVAQRMLGGDGAEGHAHEGVGARGEHPEHVRLPSVRIRESRPPRPRSGRSSWPASSSPARASRAACRAPPAVRRRMR